eukprot:945151-Prorocentrum_minimum.AAC.1
MSGDGTRGVSCCFGGAVWSGEDAEGGPQHRLQAASQGIPGARLRAECLARSGTRDVSVAGRGGVEGCGGGAEGVWRGSGTQDVFVAGRGGVEGCRGDLSIKFRRP